MVETMTVRDVADLFKVTEPTVYRWAKEGELPAIQVGRTLRFNRADVEQKLSGDGKATTTATLSPASDASLIGFLADAVVEELRRRGVIQD